MYTETVSRRFERNVDRAGDHHIWTGAVDAVRGTGRLKVGGKNLTAHRVAFELAHGELPAKVRVLACQPSQPAYASSICEWSAAPRRRRRGPDFARAA